MRAPIELGAPIRLGEPIISYFNDLEIGEPIYSDIPPLNYIITAEPEDYIIIAEPDVYDVQPEVYDVQPEYNYYAEDLVIPDIQYAPLDKMQGYDFFIQPHDIEIGGPEYIPTPPRGPQKQTRPQKQIPPRGPQRYQRLERLQKQIPPTGPQRYQRLERLPTGEVSRYKPPKPSPLIPEEVFRPVIPGQHLREERFRPVIPGYPFREYEVVEEVPIPRRKPPPPFIPVHLPQRQRRQRRGKSQPKARKPRKTAAQWAAQEDKQILLQEKIALEWAMKQREKKQRDRENILRQEREEREERESWASYDRIDEELRIKEFDEANVEVVISDDEIEDMLESLSLSESELELAREIADELIEVSSSKKNIKKKHKPIRRQAVLVDYDEPGRAESNPLTHADLENTKEYIINKVLEAIKDIKIQTPRSHIYSSANEQLEVSETPLTGPPPPPRLPPPPTPEQLRRQQLEQAQGEQAQRSAIQGKDRLIRLMEKAQKEGNIELYNQYKEMIGSGLRRRKYK